MRDKMIHDYMGVVIATIRTTAMERIPALRRASPAVSLCP